MSDYGDAIFERLPKTSGLTNPDNPVRKILDLTVGEWLERHNGDELFENAMLADATGKYLDLFGKDLGIIRELDESDEHYRNRLIYDGLGHLTVDYFLNIFELPLYVYDEGTFNLFENSLTSNNYYINNLDVMSYTTDKSVKQILENKFVYNNGIQWFNPNVIVRYEDLEPKTYESSTSERKTYNIAEYLYLFDRDFELKCDVKLSPVVNAIFAHLELNSSANNEKIEVSLECLDNKRIVFYSYRNNQNERLFLIRRVHNAVPDEYFNIKIRYVDKVLYFFVNNRFSYKYYLPNFNSTKNLFNLNLFMSQSQNSRSVTIKNLQLVELNG